MAQTFLPCHSFRNEWFRRGSKRISHTASSRGARDVSARYRRKNFVRALEWPSNETAKDGRPHLVQPKMKRVTTPRLAPAPRTPQNKSAFS